MSSQLLYSPNRSKRKGCFPSFDEYCTLNLSFNTSASICRTKESSSFFDNKTAGFGLDSDIIKLSTFDSNKELNVYIRPNKAISENTTALSASTLSTPQKSIYWKHELNKRIWDQGCLKPCMTTLNLFSAICCRMAFLFFNFIALCQNSFKKYKDMQTKLYYTL